MAFTLGLILSLVLLRSNVSSSAQPERCNTNELFNWVKLASIPAIAEETLPDWKESTDPCTWRGVTCEDGCFSELDSTNFGLSVFEKPTCDAFSLVCCLFSDPSDNPECVGPSAQECFDAIGALLVNGFAIKNRPFKKILLGGNTLMGTWPSIPAFDSLVELDLSNNVLEKDFHPLTVWEDLNGELGPEPYEVLRSYKCDGCNLVGTIPAQYDFELRNVWAQRYPGLRTLSLSGSRMVGTLPEVWGSWSSLRSLDLSNNNLTGGIPPSWGDLTDIEFVDLSGNDQLSSEIPESWAQRMTCSNEEPLRCEKR